MNTLSLLLGSVYFAFQIYGDFSGYSDMAIGLSRMLGFDLMRNFNYPYFSRDIAEFWRRWHISLSTWFRDYVYIPLGGSKGTKFLQIRNVMIIFLVSGFWHGANWTFVAWGFLNALYFLPLLLQKKNRRFTDNVNISWNLHSIRIILGILSTFILTCFAWIFFRAESITKALDYIKRIVVNQNFKVEYLNIERYSPELIILLLIFILVEWLYRDKEEPISGKYSILKITFAITAILMFGSFSNPHDFIYFQF